MGWSVLQIGSKEAAIVSRRFGPAFEKPCHHPQVIECAYWECQIANSCQGLRGPERPSPFARRALGKEAT